jgi:hypothetical protein
VKLADGSRGSQMLRAADSIKSLIVAGGEQREV